MGVSVGMRTPEAEALAGPNRLMTLPHDPGGDRRELIRLATACERFSPTVALEDVEFPEALLLDVTGLAPLWEEASEKGEERLASAVHHWFRKKKLEALVVVAATPGIALAAARRPDRLASSAGVAPMILSNDDPALGRLPVDALRVATGTIETLRSLGVETLEALLKLPRSSLPARFGSEFVRRLDQLTGSAPEPLAPVREAPPLMVSWPYETPVGNAEALSCTVGVLLEKLSQAMRSRRCGALRVLITYELDSSDAAVRVALRLFRPTASAKELHELAELHSGKLRLNFPVRAIHALVGSVAPLDIRQRALFDDDSQEGPHETALLINRLVSRVGFDRVSRVERRRSVDPDRSFALVPATDNRPTRFELTTVQAERMRRMPLAMLGSRGTPISVTTRPDGTPAIVRRRGERRVMRCWGPERIETGWWRSRGVRRDAYWVELEGGGRFWLTHDLPTRRWRVAGEFV